MLMFIPEFSEKLVDLCWMMELCVDFLLAICNTVFVIKLVAKVPFA